MTAKTTIAAKKAKEAERFGPRQRFAAVSCKGLSRFYHCKPFSASNLSFRQSIVSL